MRVEHLREAFVQFSVSNYKGFEIVCQADNKLILLENNSGYLLYKKTLKIQLNCARLGDLNVNPGTSFFYKKTKIAHYD